MSYQYKLTARVRPRGQRWLTREALITSAEEIECESRDDHLELMKRNNLIGGGETVSRMSIEAHTTT